MEKVPVQLTISRNSAGTVTVSVRCVRSRVEFLDMEMTTVDFANALFSMAFQPGVATLRGLDVLGKKLETRPRRAIIPAGVEFPYTSDRDYEAEWLLANCQEPGWEICTYLGSRDSIVRNPDGSTTVNYSVMRYLDVSRAKRRVL